MKKHVMFAALALSTVAVACGGPSTSSTDGMVPMSDDFCQSAAQATSAFMMSGMLFDPDNPDKDTVRAAWTSIVALGKNMAKNAPDEIRDEAQIIADSYSQTLELLKSVDYDITEAFGGADIEISDSAEVSDAQDALNNYLETECGMSLES